MSQTRFNKSVDFLYAHRIPIILVLLSLLILSCKSHKKAETEGKALSGTPLDRYVDTADSDFGYHLVHQSSKEGYTLYILRMTSQKWLNKKLVEQPTWWHWLSIVVPHKLNHDTAFVWIGGGDRNDELPEKASSMLVRSAMLTNSIAVGIHNIPNQPVHFAGDTVDGRYEDGLIAYGWRKFLEGGASHDEAEWLARLPMTNAVQCAMDAVTEFVSDKEGLKIEKFTVAGASKRGWTTWTTAAVDDRVVAIIPVVIDLLNLEQSFRHHWRNYGFWAPAIKDYVDEGIMAWMGSEEFDRLLSITGPYSYVNRYDMPKLLINAAGDQFFQPDSWQFYWDNLQEEKYLRYVPNAGHSLEDTDAVETMIAFYNAILDHSEFPDFSWEIDRNHMHIETNPQAPLRKIKIWSAGNRTERDFRVSVIGRAWQDSTLEMNANGKYDITLSEPENGWKAFFVELTYNYRLPLKLTTGVKVLPEAHPHPPFESPDPKGTRD